jgi:NAD(P)-dependent dehydrogenase (short-subunit alcohol dehydrogenase family)
MVEAPLV